MKKLLIISLFVVNIFAADYIFNLNNFISFVAKQNNITIIVDKNLNIPIEVSISNKVYPVTYLQMLKKILKKNGLILVKKNNFYYVEQIKDYKSLHILNVNSVDIQSLDKIMNFLDLNYTYNKDNNVLAFISDYKSFLYTKKLLSRVDKSFKSAKLKVTIISSDYDKLKNLNFKKLNLSIPSSSHLNFNFLLDPLSVLSSNSFNIDVFLNFLIKHDITKLVSNPVISLFNNKKTTFVIANNIPYETSDITFSNNTQVVQKKYDYKDVGLVMNVVPHFLSNNKVLLDFDLQFSHIVKLSLDSSKTPYTTKKQIKQSLVLQAGKKYFLSGLIQTNDTIENTKIPIFSDFPVVGKIFRFSSNNKERNVLTIILELKRGGGAI